MRKLIIILFLLLMTPTSVFAAKLPDNVRNYVETSFPNTDFRFDGVIILPDNTIYLPLFPAKIISPEVLNIKRTVPANKAFTQKPDVVFFNNDYVLLKVLEKEGKRTVHAFSVPPEEIANGLLPQDMLVPQGLTIPESMHGIIGNLDIEMAKDPTLKVPTEIPKTGAMFSNLATIPQLINKTLYIATCYSRNIQVVNAENKSPEYALLQANVPIHIAGYDEKYLIITSYGKMSVDVLSLKDEQVIKQIYLKSQPDEIIIDNKNHLGYISVPDEESIYVINLDSMTLNKQIKVNGRCEKLTLSDSANKLFYVDKNTNEIWAVELDNDFLLKDIGKFPNVSKIVFANNKLYIASRTKNRVAIIDYIEDNLVKEIDVSPKPIDMLVSGDNLFILGALENVVQVLDLNTQELTDTVYLNTNGFSTKLYKIEGTDLALITDTKASLYSLLDLKSKQVVKTNILNTPVTSVVVTEKVKKINK